MVPVQDPVKSRPVATAVIGSPRTDGGHLGPGLLPVTDQIGILTAFAARSMTYVEPEDNIIDEFVEFSKTFLQPFIDGTDCTELTDEDPIVYFRNHYRGKRSQSWIEGQINQFNFYESGLADISFDSHSCFVKLENSSKEVDGTYQLRPRLIMTMSPVMLFKCCRILAVVDRWNRGPFSRFQVKDMDPAEMIQKIMEFSDRAHTVTDYSSFESSITGRIRVIENFVIESLLAKAGMHETLRDFSQPRPSPSNRVRPGITRAGAHSGGAPTMRHTTGELDDAARTSSRISREQDASSVARVLKPRAAQPELESQPRRSSSEHLFPET
jgi:hypothetical protein